MYSKGNDRLKWIGLVCLVGMILFFLWQNQDSREDPWELAIQETSQQTSTVQSAGQQSVGGSDHVEQREPAPKPKLALHIAGEIHKPGVYYLPMGARVVDLIKAAGGVTNTADLNQVNLAQPVADGQKVFIPAQQFNSQGNQIGGMITTGETMGWTGTGSNGSSNAGSGGGKVCINTASKEQLQTLTGVGPSKAGAILQYRDEHGPFRKLEDLMKISGIGEKTFTKLKDQITLY